MRNIGRSVIVSPCWITCHFADWRLTWDFCFLNCDRRRLVIVLKALVRVLTSQEPRGRRRCILSRLNTFLWLTRVHVAATVCQPCSPLCLSRFRRTRRIDRLSYWRDTSWFWSIYDTCAELVRDRSLTLTGVGTMCHEKSTVCKFGHWPPRVIENTWGHLWASILLMIR